MVNYLWKETWNQLKYQIFQFWDSLVLILPALTFFFTYLQCFFLVAEEYVRKSFWGYYYILKVNVSCLLKRVYLPYRGLNLIRKLMGSNALNDAVILVSKDNVALGVKL